MDSKLCPKCGVTKPLSGFHKDRSRPSGVYSWCKECNYANVKQRREATREKHDAYKEYLRQYRREQRGKNPEEYRRQKNRIAAAWRSANPGKARMMLARRRRRIRHAGEMPSTRELCDLVESLGGVCVYCGDEWRQIDHVVPLVNGGTNERWNLVPACPRCNASKNARDVTEWYSEQPFFDPERLRFILGRLSPQPPSPCKTG